MTKSANRFSLLSGGSVIKRLAAFPSPDLFCVALPLGNDQYHNLSKAHEPHWNLCFRDPKATTQRRAPNAAIIRIYNKTILADNRFPFVSSDYRCLRLCINRHRNALNFLEE